MPDPTYLSLFSGIGGLDLGLDRAGWRCVGQVERDEFCRSVLAKHWPEVPRHDDVRTAVEWWGVGDRPTVRMVAGGFPCQPFSSAGLGRGVDDPRWGWPWFSAVVRAVRPRYVLVENVPALLRHTAAFGRILGDLADLGFDARWSLLSACSFGAPHTRERLFLLAYTPGFGGGPRRRPWPSAWRLESSGRDAEQGGPWAGESGIHGVAYGASQGVDRRRAVGNAVVPRVAEHIGRLILAADREVSGG